MERYKGVEVQRGKEVRRGEEVQRDKEVKRHKGVKRYKGKRPSPSYVCYMHNTHTMRCHITYSHTQHTV